MPPKPAGRHLLLQILSQQLRNVRHLEALAVLLRAATDLKHAAGAVHDHTGRAGIRDAVQLLAKQRGEHFGELG